MVLLPISPSQGLDALDELPVELWRRGDDPVPVVQGSSLAEVQLLPLRVRDDPPGLLHDDGPRRVVPDPLLVVQIGKPHEGGRLARGDHPVLPLLKSSFFPSESVTTPPASSMMMAP